MTKLQELRAENAELKEMMEAYDHAALAPSDTPAMRALRYDYDQLDQELREMKENPRSAFQIERNEIRLLGEIASMRRTIFDAGIGKFS